MYSLFYVLANQHGEEFAPVRCNEQTVTRLIRYFEDVVTESNLSALVIEGRCLNGQPGRELERAAKLSTVAQHCYLFSCNGACGARTWNPEDSAGLTILEESTYHDIETGPFILVMDHRFSGLLASSRLSEQEAGRATVYEMIWTFDPNVVFTAIEYLMARISIQMPRERSHFATVLNNCTPHTSSLRLALTLSTKLTMLMQRQNELEIAINRVSSAISSTLELGSILQSAVEEVGRALDAHRVALVLWEEGTGRPEGMRVYERPAEAAPEPDQPSQEAPPDTAGDRQIQSRQDELARFEDISQQEDRGLNLSESQDSIQQQAQSLNRKNSIASDAAVTCLVAPGPLEVPITYRENIIGMLLVEDVVPGRDWEDEEVLMVKTVSDQLAVAISHARLFRQIQTQAMTDSLTGLYNHRYFQERLDREIKLADRNNESVSMILLDLDYLKRINDSFGHRMGDAALNHVAHIMQKSVREIDICARYGGEEFVIILPQCEREDAINVAERLREAIASTALNKIGRVTASIGVATYPTCSKSKEELIEMADRAMYQAKAAGRNRVRSLMQQNYTDINFEPLHP